MKHRSQGRNSSLLTNCDNQLSRKAGIFLVAINPNCYDEEFSMEKNFYDKKSSIFLKFM